MMLSLIIPCFNEESNLNKLLNTIDTLFKKYPEEKIEIILVDNGSTDNSNKLIKKNKLFLDKKINLIEIDNNVGYGDGIYRGITSSKGNFVAWCHADLQADLKDVIVTIVPVVAPIANVTVPVEPPVSVYSVGSNISPFFITQHCPLI